jgi:PST family polysaccharide transporter
MFLKKKINLEYKKLLKNFISLVIVQGGNYILPLITFPYLVMHLGIENYGKVTYALAFSQYFVILTSFGFNLSTPKEIAENIINTNRIKRIFTDVLIGKTFLLVLSAILILMLSYTVPIISENILIIQYSFIAVIAQAIMPIWLFQGLENMKWITVINIFSKILYTISIFIFIKAESDFILVPLISGISQLIAAIIGLFIVFFFLKISFLKPTISDMMKQLRFSAPFFLSRVSVSLYTTSNTFFLGTFGTMEMAGNFAIAEKLYMALQGVYHPAVNALYPFISRLKKNDIFINILKRASILNFFFLLLIYLLSEHIFNILFKNYNLISLEIFKYILFICVFIFPSILLGYPFLAAMGHSKFTNSTVIIASILHVLLLLLLSFLGSGLDEFKIVVALFFTEATVLILRIYGIRKYNLW